MATSASTAIAAARMTPTVKVAYSEMTTIRTPDSIRRAAAGRTSVAKALASVKTTQETFDCDGAEPHAGRTQESRHDEEVEAPVDDVPDVRPLGPKL